MRIVPQEPFSSLPDQAPFATGEFSGVLSVVRTKADGPALQPRGFDRLFLAGGNSSPARSAIHFTAPGVARQESP
jgi:hypothetical protein